MTSGDREDDIPRLRTVRLEVEGEQDTWSGFRYEAWETNDGYKARKSKVFITDEIPPELGETIDIKKQAFEDIWSKVIETSKDRFSVGIPRYTQRELMLMPLDPTIWSLVAKDGDEECLTFTVTGGPRTPVQDDLCNLLKGLF